MKYKLLGRSGLRVSEICLGTMTMGTEWGYGADKETSKEIFDTFVNAGGNFIDTANLYTEGTSERFVGEFAKAERSNLVLATKYSLRTGDVGLQNRGNHRKNMVQSVEDSLKRMGLEYIDLYYLHAWDFTTPIDEVMRGLDDLVRAGKILYVAVSDSPAWIVSRANTLAELRGWSPFIGLQVEYSLFQRTPERDLLPMADALEIGVTAWAPLAGGALTGKYLESSTQEHGRLKPESIRRGERAKAIAAEVVAIGSEIGKTPAQVALRWVMQQGHTIVPIVGARKVAQIQDSVGAVGWELSTEHLSRLNEVSAVEVGFPHDFLQSEGVTRVLFGDSKPTIEFRRRN